MRKSEKDYKLKNYCQTYDRIINVICFLLSCHEQICFVLMIIVGQ